MSIAQVLRILAHRAEELAGRDDVRERRASEKVVRQFTRDPAFPYLVSFPRTGSHWLRLLMEAYFGAPSLRLAFFQSVKDTTDYTCLHTHDLDLSVQRARVLYLFRDLVDTLYSQMTYHAQDLNDVGLVEGWADLYGRHLNKWLVEETFTVRKAVVTYEGLKEDLATEFDKVASFFGLRLEIERLRRADRIASKETIKGLTKHDPHVISQQHNYGAGRAEFREMHATRIETMIFERYPDLREWFGRDR